MLHRWDEDGRHWLLMRRSLTDPLQKAYYFVFGPQNTTLTEMVRPSAPAFISKEISKRRRIGDRTSTRVRSLVGWYRHITLVMLAHAFLSGLCAQNIPLASPPLAGQIPTTREAASDARPLLPLTVPEVRHLLGRLIWPASSSVKLVLAWSWWRRRHRGLARGASQAMAGTRGTACFSCCFVVWKPRS
jgi:hypothetical protein